MLLFARNCGSIFTSSCSSEITKIRLYCHMISRIVIWMPYNTSPDKCSGWRQVEAAVVLGSQETLVEVTASINASSSHCGILTQIQIQGGDGKKSLALWGGGAGGLRLCDARHSDMCHACILSLHYC